MESSFGEEQRILGDERSEKEHAHRKDEKARQLTEQLLVIEQQLAQRARRDAQPNENERKAEDKEAGADVDRFETLPAGTFLIAHRSDVDSGDDR